MNDNIDQLDAKIDKVHQELSDKIEAIRDELASIKLWWAIGLAIGLWASLLFAMAKGFKWL